jgi:hypothetical protein
MGNQHRARIRPATAILALPARTDLQTQTPNIQKTIVRTQGNLEEAGVTVFSTSDKTNGEYAAVTVHAAGKAVPGLVERRHERRVVRLNCVCF